MKKNTISLIWILVLIFIGGLYISGLWIIVCDKDFSLFMKFLLSSFGFVGILWVSLIIEDRLKNRSSKNK